MFRKPYFIFSKSNTRTLRIYFIIFKNYNGWWFRNRIIIIGIHLHHWEIGLIVSLEDFCSITQLIIKWISAAISKNKNVSIAINFARRKKKRIQWCYHFWPTLSDGSYFFGLKNFINKYNKRELGTYLRCYLIRYELAGSTLIFLSQANISSTNKIEKNIFLSSWNTIDIICTHIPFST